MHYISGPTTLLSLLKLSISSKTLFLSGRNTSSCKFNLVKFLHYIFFLISTPLAYSIMYALHLCFCGDMAVSSVFAAYECLHVCRR